MGVGDSVLGHEIFISYSREDRETAERLATDLERRGRSVWWDTRLMAGEIFDEVIEEELTSAGVVVVLWSADSVKSRWVKIEARHAQEANKLLPASIGPVKPPFGFRDVHAEDLVSWRGEQSHPGYEKLVDAVERQLDRQQEKTAELIEKRIAALRANEKSFEDSRKGGHDEMMASIRSGMPIEMVVLTVSSKIADKWERQVVLDLELLAIIETVETIGKLPSEYDLPTRATVLRTLGNHQEAWTKANSGLTSMVKGLKQMVNTPIRPIR